jgi:diguanylate cyclase (GGDEF)-like protein
MPGTFTTIVNHDLFNYLLDLEVKRATRYSYFFSLLFLEIDQEFHPDVSDTAARLILDEIREVDIVGKVETKRFSVLLQAETKPTLYIAERIRGRILNYSFNNFNHKEPGANRQAGEKDLKITVSVGGACFPTHGSDAGELTAQALLLLDKARVEGGNKVYVHDLL